MASGQPAAARPRRATSRLADWWGLDPGDAPPDVELFDYDGAGAESDELDSNGLPYKDYAEDD